MDPLNLKEFSCPYCGETNSLWIETTGSTRQQFVQDCEVCCHPIRIALKIQGELVDIRTERENE